MERAVGGVSIGDARSLLSVFSAASGNDQVRELSRPMVDQTLEKDNKSALSHQRSIQSVILNRNFKVSQDNIWGHKARELNAARTWEGSVVAMETKVQSAQNTEQWPISVQGYDRAVFNYYA